MTTGRAASSSTSAEALPLRMRRDLIAKQMSFAGRNYWSIKDPASLRYYQLREEEYYLLRSLDGKRSVEAIRAAFERRFPPLRLGNRQLQSYLGMLHSQGLIVADTPGQAEALLERRRHWRRRQQAERLANVLAIRFRGVDPDRFLGWLYPKCRWIFSRGCAAAALLLVLATLTLLVAEYETVRARLPGFYAFFNLQNLLGIALAVGFAKVFHELGHALTCKHFGGQCHEMGIMLLVFAPCLYCNVSDAWLMSNKWHRIAISAAGICVEIVLASIATWLWWFSEPGRFSAICLNLMFVCSVSTVLFNGNPLLRYDGYYILSDLLEVPNLRQQSTAILQRALGRWLLGIPPGSDRMLPGRDRRLLAGYAVAAVLYRFVVVVAILWLVRAVLKPYGLEVFAQLLAVLVIGGMVVAPIWRWVRFVLRGISNEQVKPFRAFLCLGAIAAVLIALLCIPLPTRVTAPAVIQPASAARVYVEVTGRLTSSRRAGDRVEAGQTLATLEDPALDEKIAELRGQVAVLQTRLDHLRTRRVQDRQAAGQLPATEEALRHVQQQLRQKLDDRARLTLKAPVSGIVLPPPAKDEPPVPGQLDSWSGTPLDRDNLRCTLESGTTFCLIGDPRRLEAVLVIDQSDVELVRRGQPVHLWLKQAPGKTLWGEVIEMAEGPLEFAPRQLAAGGRLPVVRDESGLPRPASASVQARVALEPSASPILLRTTGWAKIHVAPQSIAQRVARYLRSTFRFER